MPVIRACQHCGAKNRLASAHLADTGRCGACKQPIPPVNEPIAADAALFDEVLRSARVPVLVDFWADWCGPCHMAAPHVEQTAANMAGKAIVLKVDTDKHPELAGRYNVRGIPNFAVFADGKLVRQQAGVVPQTTMEEWLRSAQSEAVGGRPK